MDEVRAPFQVAILEGNMTNPEFNLGIPFNDSDPTCTEILPIKLVNGSLQSTKGLVVYSVFQAVVSITVLISSVGLNGLVILLIPRHRALRTEPYWYLPLQLTANNLLFTLLHFPAGLASLRNGVWALGFLMCQLNAFIEGWLTNTRWLLMFAFTIDRFLRVFAPYWYPARGGKVVALLSTCSWVLGFGLTIPPARGLLDCYTFWLATSSCTALPICPHFHSCLTYVIVSTSIVVFLGGLVPVVLYAFLLRRGRQLQNRVQPLVIPVINGKDESGERLTVSEKKQSNRRATNTFILLFFNLLGCYLPYYILSVATATSRSLGNPPRPLVGKVYLFLAAPLTRGILIADPITIMRNQDFRKALRKFFQTRPNSTGGRS